MKRKLLLSAVLAVSAISSAVLTSCGGGGDDNSSSSSNTPQVVFTEADIQSLFESGPNNVLGQSTTTPTNPHDIDSFFDPATFIGAYDPNNDWRQGWAILDDNNNAVNIPNGVGDGVDNNGNNASCPTGTTAGSDLIISGNTYKVCVLSGNITQDITLTSDFIYELKGKVSVKEGATLTIEQGTIIYGNDTDSDESADYLVIERGAKINAVGTKNFPIVFTGKKALTGDDKYSSGQWGGVIIAGYARTNAGNDQGEEQFEADHNIIFGGNNDADNSGTMKYVIIRNGGKAIAPDEEINGLTLLGVGSGTTLDYIEVYRNLDDGIEWFGGTVNAKHIVLIGNEDDNLDTDHGYRGKLQYVYIKQTVVSSSDPRGIEADNLKANNNATPRSAPVVANLTIENAVPSTATIQPHEAIMLRRGTDYQIINAVITGNERPDNCIEVRNVATYNALKDNNHYPPFISVALDNVCAKGYFGVKDNTQ